MSFIRQQDVSLCKMLLLSLERCLRSPLRHGARGDGGGRGHASHLQEEVKEGLSRAQGVHVRAEEPLAGSDERVAA